MSAVTSVSAWRDGAEAASTTIRLRAYVPVYCALKPVPYISNTFGSYGGHHGGPPKFKVVCNTPYHMHMEGSWDKPGWPHLPWGHGKDAHGKDHGKDHNDRDVQLRLTGKDSTQQALCAFAGGREKSCRTLIDDDAFGPPRVGEVTFGRPSYAGKGRDDGHSGSQEFSFSAPGSQQGHWGGRMSLGALPRVASADDWPYLPSFVTEMERAAPAAATDGVDDGFLAAEDAEQLTLFLTVTGRY